METKPLLFGLIGFFIGGLLVSVAATTFDKPVDHDHVSEMTMSQMTQDLQDKKGTAFDDAFVTHMIEHHQAAVDMAKLGVNRAERQEIKDLSAAIIRTQQHEINEMKHWQSHWGDADASSSESHSH